MDKDFFKRILKSHQLPILDYEVINLKVNIEDELDRIIASLGLPLFLKPVSEGGSLGCAVIHNKNQFANLIKQNMKSGFDSYLAEAYTKGRTMTVGIVEINKKLKALPVLETISMNEFYDYEAKHNPSSRIYKCPAILPETIYKTIQSLAIKTHTALACHGFCRVDFILDHKSNPYILEVNTLPGLSSMSNMAVMAETAGISYDELVNYLLQTSFTKPDYLP